MPPGDGSRGETATSSHPPGPDVSLVSRATSAFLFLLFMPVVIAEFLTGSTPLPSLVDPLTLLTLLGLYGAGAPSGEGAHCDLEEGLADDPRPGLRLRHNRGGSGREELVQPSMGRTRPPRDLRAAVRGQLGLGDGAHDIPLCLQHRSAHSAGDAPVPRVVGYPLDTGDAVPRWSPEPSWSDVLFGFRLFPLLAAARAILPGRRHGLAGLRPGGPAACPASLSSGGSLSPMKDRSALVALGFALHDRFLRHLLGGPEPHGPSGLLDCPARHPPAAGRLGRSLIRSAPAEISVLRARSPAPSGS